ncbi:hypothetical protein CFP56_009161 [Quercus suber]|uniref:Uncharacterized protein n=1 Tax=Quercus suber TaxID=58331 RepID=A0AAW0L2S3_QUESU
MVRGEEQRGGCSVANGVGLGLWALHHRLQPNTTRRALLQRERHSGYSVVCIQRLFFEPQSVPKTLLLFIFYSFF